MDRTGSEPEFVAALRAAFGDLKVVDLTHPLQDGMPVWPTHPPFRRMVVETYEGGQGSYTHSALALGEHTGTHLDAAVHHVVGRGTGASIETVPPERLLGRAVVLDAAAVEPRGTAGLELIEAWETRHGPIGSDDAVVFRFGWDRRWSAVETWPQVLRDWPGLSAAAAEALVVRRVRLVGTDCLSIDAFGSAADPAHRALLAARIPICENLARLDELPPICWLMVLPLAVVGGSGSPARAVAFVPRVVTAAARK